MASLCYSLASLLLLQHLEHVPHVVLALAVRAFGGFLPAVTSAAPYNASSSSLLRGLSSVERRLGLKGIALSGIFSSSTSGYLSTFSTLILCGDDMFVSTPSPNSSFVVSYCCSSLGMTTFAADSVLRVCSYGFCAGLSTTSSANFIFFAFELASG